MSDGAVRARTRVVEVEAFKMTEAAFSAPEAWPAWVDVAVPKRSVSVTPRFYIRNPVMGVHYLSAGDWIINTAGELSVCTPEEFEAGYEAVGETDRYYISEADGSVCMRLADGGTEVLDEYEVIKRLNGDA